MSAAALTAVSLSWIVVGSGLPLARATDAQTGILGAAAQSSWQTNGVVYALAVDRGVVYLGGSFTSVRPPGTGPGTGEVSRPGVAAFDAATGELLPKFAPSVTSTTSTRATVYSLAVSPDGGTVYVGGQFTTVDGVAKPSVAAVASDSGALTTWATRIPSGIVYGLTVSPDGTVYIGGQLGTIDGVRRLNAGAVDAAGQLLPWAPAVGGGQVRDIQLSPDGQNAVIGGNFTTVDGANHKAIMAVDAQTGNLDAAWGAGPYFNDQTQTWQLTGTADALYVSAGDFGGSAARFEGTAKLNWADGSVIWADYCFGDTHAIAVVGSVVYAGSHAHDCSKVPGGFPTLSRHQDLLADSTADGRQLDWYPQTNSSPSPEQNGPRVMATDGTQLFLGGDFTLMNGKPQQGFARFGPGGNTAPSLATPPMAEANSDGSVSVAQDASVDADDGTLTYSLFRDNQTTAVDTEQAASAFYASSIVRLRDPAPPSGRHTYTVHVSDGTDTVVSRLSNAVFVNGPAPTTFVQAITATGPAFWWRLDESPAATAKDSTYRTSGGSYTGATSGAVPGSTSDGDRAASFDGSSSAVFTKLASTPQQTFSAGISFRTTTTRGGKLFGNGGSPTGISRSYDRHVYMTNDGRLVFGVFNGQLNTITTNGSYNDGQWHQVVATLDGGTMALYVDGQLVGSRTGAGAESRLVGYWRIGGDNLDGWPNTPTSRYYAGQLDEFAVWQYALAPGQVATLYTAR